MTAPLFSPFQLRSVELRNRIGVSPMCQYSSEDGFANDWHLAHLGSRAQGGAGLVSLEASAVLPEGRISPADLGVWKDEHIPNLRRIAEFLHTQGSRAGMQLAHAGRKASTATPFVPGRVLVTPAEGGWQPVAPSAIAFAPDYAVPTALDSSGIRAVVEGFRHAALRALEAGFDFVEIHAAHGYLLHEFLSPLANRRTDAYGGSFDNRIRLVLEVVDAVRREWPERLPLFVRISATDWADGGWNPDESVQLAHRLREHGVDLVDASSGGLVPDAKVPVAPGYQVGFACENPPRGRHCYGRGWTDHRAGAGQRHHRRGRGRSCVPGARHAARSLLAGARSGCTGRTGKLAEAVFARRAARLARAFRNSSQLKNARSGEATGVNSPRFSSAKLGSSPDFASQRAKSVPYTACRARVSPRPMRLPSPNSMATQLNRKRAYEPPAIPDRLYFKIGDVARTCAAWKPTFCVSGSRSFRN